MTKYTVDYYIKKFRAIPESKWITDKVEDGKGRHCVLGFCGLKLDGDWSEEAIQLETILDKNWKLAPAWINDGKNPYTLKSDEKYDLTILGKSPKERILVALENIKGMKS